MLILKPVPIVHASFPCYGECRFRFCNDVVRFHIPHRRNFRPRTRLFTGRICSKYSDIIGKVEKTGEAFVMDYHYLRGFSFIRISEWGPRGLTDKFSRTFFKSMDIWTPRANAFYSGLGREKPTNNQLDILQNRCIIVPIRRYEELNRYGHRIHYFSPSGMPLRDCISFTST